MSTYICKKCGNPNDLDTSDAHIYGSDETYMSLEWCPNCPDAQNMRGEDGYSGGDGYDGGDEDNWDDDDQYGEAYDDDDGGSASGGSGGGRDRDDW